MFVLVAGAIYSMKYSLHFEFSVGLWAVSFIGFDSVHVFSAAFWSKTCEIRVTIGQINVHFVENRERVNWIY